MADFFINALHDEPGDGTVSTGVGWMAKFLKEKSRDYVVNGDRAFPIQGWEGEQLCNDFPAEVRQMQNPATFRNCYKIFM